MCLFDRFYKLKLSEVEQKLNFKLLCEHIVQPFSRWWRSSLWAQTEGDSVFVQADGLQGPVSDTLIWFSLNGLVESTPASRRIHVTASRVGTRWVFVGSEVFFSAAAALSFSPDVNCSHSASWWFCLKQTSVWFWFWFWSVSDVCPGDTGTLLSGGVTNITSSS